jgi:hypothetical protein
LVSSKSRAFPYSIGTLTRGKQTQTAWKGLDSSAKAILVNNPKGGHMQDFFSMNGGLIAFAGRSWFDWILKNSTEGKQNLVGQSKIKSAGWTVSVKGLS